MVAQLYEILKLLNYTIKIGKLYVEYITIKLLRKGE